MGRVSWMGKVVEVRGEGEGRVGWSCMHTISYTQHTRMFLLLLTGPHLYLQPSLFSFLHSMALVHCINPTKRSRRAEAKTKTTDQASVGTRPRSSGRRRLWAYSTTIALFWQTLAMSSLADRTVRIIGATTAPCRPAFASLQMMSSLGSGNKRSRSSSSSSSSFKKLSSLSSTPFPAYVTKTKKKPIRQQTRHHFSSGYNATSSSSWSNDIFISDDYQGHENDPNPSPLFERKSPFPTMPSPLFTNLAQSQFELLSNSLVHTTDVPTENSDRSNGYNDIQPGTPKISSMALYLPKENPNTGQLEFVPAATYPKNPSSERVFIASESPSNIGGIHQPPTVPSRSMVGELPGFFKAKDLIPSYPFISSSTSLATEDDVVNNAGIGEQEMFTTISPDSPISVGIVEEIDSPNGLTSLSVTLLSGMDTLGVLMIWPNDKISSSTNKDNGSDRNQNINQWKWTPNDKLQLTRAAKSLALALSMDNERASTQLANEQFRVAMADGLHQVKSPLQALRTFGKLLQMQLAEENADGRSATASVKRVPATPRKQRQALKLAEDLMSQGERVIGLIEPMDALVQNGGRRYLLRGDIKDNPSSTTASALMLQPSNGVMFDNKQSSSDDTEVNHRQRQQQLQLPPSMPILGDFEPEMAFPQDVLGSIVYASQAISRERGINFDATGFEPDNLDLPGVTICPKHLNEAVSNLLDNAIKYAPLRRKGKVGRPRIPQIKVTLTSNEPPLSPGATLYVEDNGPGIPASERDSVFERGYRGEDVRDDADVAGSGLGLAIAREMISMVGTIDVLDAGEGPNKLDGTTVRVVLFRDRE
mmetsp:Transcript_28848/g.54539  ORF Transcript_28848/g.54539 Transcript_28848/m.54539 type:complete len:819 (+) Transcript_28848:69-2525(+)